MKKLMLIILIIANSCAKDDVKIRQGHCVPFFVSDTYEFPIMPGTEKWNQLESLAAKVQVCQIPDQKLREISTEGLLETLLSYPLILDYIFFDKMQNGFNRIKTENNGFVELYKRNDLFKVITLRYEIMSVDCQKNLYPPFILKDKEGAPNPIAFQTYEFFMLQDELLNNIDNENRIKLFKLVFDKLIMKNNDAEFYPKEKLVSYAILGKIMKMNNYNPFVEACVNTDFLSLFIEKVPTYYPANIHPVDSISSYSSNYFQSLSKF